MFLKHKYKRSPHYSSRKLLFAGDGNHYSVVEMSPNGRISVATLHLRLIKTGGGESLEIAKCHPLQIKIYLSFLHQCHNIVLIHLEPQMFWEKTGFRASVNSSHIHFPIINCLCLYILNKTDDYCSEFCIY